VKLNAFLLQLEPSSERVFLSPPAFFWRFPQQSVALAYFQADCSFQPKTEFLLQRLQIYLNFLTGIILEI